MKDRRRVPVPVRSRIPVGREKLQIGGSRSVPLGDGLTVDDTPSRLTVTIGNRQRSRRMSRPAAERRELLKSVYEEARDCERCPLHQTRTQVVFGSGNADAGLMLKFRNSASCGFMLPPKTEEAFGNSSPGILSSSILSVLMSPARGIRSEGATGSTFSSSTLNKLLVCSIPWTLLWCEMSLSRR